MSTPDNQQPSEVLKGKTLFVFDVESVGLHGEGFSVGWVVVKDGAEYEASYLACDMEKATGDDASRKWCIDNIPTLPSTHSSPKSVRDAFWSVWKLWKNNGAIMVADCAWPVEARFLAQCVDDSPSDRAWEGPYPLHDCASIIMALGSDPLVTNERLDSELPRHNPVCDARQSDRMIREASAATAALLEKQAAREREVEELQAENAELLLVLRRVTGSLGLIRRGANPLAEGHVANYTEAKELLAKHASRQGGSGT